MKSRTNASRYAQGVKQLSACLNSEPKHCSCQIGRRDTEDLAAAFRLIFEAEVAPRLSAMAESIRAILAANDGGPEANALVYRLPGLLKRVGVSKSTWYAWSNPKSVSYDPSLPKAIKLGNYARSPSVWRASEVKAWLEARAHASRSRAE